MVYPLGQIGMRSESSPTLNKYENIKMYRHAVRAIKSAEENNMIRRCEYKDRKKYFRVSEPKISEMYESLPDEIKLHLDLMVGDRQHRYCGGYDFRIKQRRLYDIAGCMCSVGASIDFDYITCLKVKGYDNLPPQRDTRSIFKNGEVRDSKEILSDVRDEEIVFFTNKAIRRSAVKSSITSQPRIMMSRVIGYLVSGKNTYSCYYVGGAKESWFKDVEWQTGERFTRLCKSLPYYLKHRNEIPDLQVIIYTKNTEVFKNLLTGEKVSIKPLEVYRLAYYLPMSENVDDMTAMLTINDWKKKLDTCFGLKKDDNINGDGVLETGDEVFNFLCCNIGRFVKMQGYIQRSKPVLIIHEWMEEFANEFFGSECPKRIVSNDEFKQMLSVVKEL